MSLGDKLRQRRQEMGLTRPQLAAKICVTPSAIANYENGISVTARSSKFMTIPSVAKRLMPSKNIGNFPKKESGLFV